jgi:hypothetical protein
LGKKTKKKTSVKTPSTEQIKRIETFQGKKTVKRKRRTRDQTKKRKEYNKAQDESYAEFLKANGIEDEGDSAGDSDYSEGFGDSSLYESSRPVDETPLQRSIRLDEEENRPQPDDLQDGKIENPHLRQ